MTKPLTLPAYAKINLFLHITGQRSDGYHNLQTIFQFVDLCDSLTFAPSKINDISLESNIQISEKKDNLIFKAAEAIKPFAQNYCGLNITINKKIPMGAGLGGGSSDAATALIALNHLWKCDLSKQKLLHLASQLGADVPVFIHGKIAWAEGTGNVFSSFDYPEQYVLLIFPKIHSSTTRFFKHPELNKASLPITPEAFQIETTHNAFEPIFVQLHPETQEIIEYASQYSLTRLTGTGSCIYCLNPNKSVLQNLQKNLAKDLDTLLTKTVNSAAVDQMI